MRYSFTEKSEFGTLPTYIKEENTDKVKEIDRDYRERERQSK